VESRASREFEKNGRTEERGGAMGGTMSGERRKEESSGEWGEGGGEKGDKGLEGREREMGEGGRETVNEEEAHKHHDPVCEPKVSNLRSVLRQL